MTSANHWLCDRRNDGNACAIVFSNYLTRDPGPTSFSFRGLLRNEPRNLLFVKDPSNHWYNRGIAGLGNSLDENVERLKSILDANGWTDVTCVGASMGGYGALLYGGLLGAKSVLAFSPQTFLAPPFPRYDRDYHQGDYVDLSIPGILDSIGQATILLSADDLFDVYSVLRLPQHPSRQLVFLRNASHLIPRMLAEKGTFQRVLAGFVATGETDATLIGETDVRASEHAETVRDAVEAYYEEDSARAESAYRKLLAEVPGWPGCQHGMARILLRRGNSREAETFYLDALKGNPNLYEAAHELAQIYGREGRLADSARLAAEAAALNPIFDGTRNQAIDRLIDSAESGKGAASADLGTLLDNANYVDRLPDAARARLVRLGFKLPPEVSGRDKKERRSSKMTQERTRPKRPAKK